MGKNLELRGLICSKYNSEAQLSRELGWGKQRLNLYTNGLREPRLRDVVTLARKLGVSVEEMVYIFLRGESSNAQLAVDEHRISTG